MAGVRNSGNCGLRDGTPVSGALPLNHGSIWMTVWQINAGKCDCKTTILRGHNEHVINTSDIFDTTVVE